MPSLSIFPADVLRTYADLIHQRLGVRVVIRGREIFADLKRHVIHLPNLEGASEDDLRPLLGFALHEAAHVRWTRAKALREMDSFLLSDTENWFEDEFIERKLASRFPGARERIRYSHEHGYALTVKGEADGDGRPLTLFRVSDRGYVGDSAHLREVMVRQGRAGLPKGAGDEEAYQAMLSAVRERMAALGLPDSEADALRELAKRYEISWFLWLWSCEWRDFSDARVRRLFAEHPWRAVLDRVNAARTRNSFDCLERAKALIKALDVHPVLPRDPRPGPLLRDARKGAAKAKAEAREARRGLRRMRARLAEEARKEADASPESAELARRSEAAATAQAACDGATRNADRAGAEAERARAKLDETRQRLAGKPETAERKALLGRRKAEAGEAEAARTKAGAALDETTRALRDAKREEDVARSDYRAKCRETLAQSLKRERSSLDALRDSARKAKARASEAVAKARELAETVAEGDGEVRAPLDRETLEKIVREVLRKLRATTIEEELGEDMPEEDPEDGDGTALAIRVALGSKAETPVPAKPEAALSARRYLPYDRTLDTVERVPETPEAAAKYAAACTGHARVIAEAREHLRRLYSPTLSRLRPNADRGRLDPRQAYKLGLALRGANADLSRVWRRLEVRRDPKVAVTMLLDCSGSMAGEKIALARAAACCLSEVLRSLSVPHEILGHTTDEICAPGFTPEIRHDYSRFVSFRGLIFREFGEGRTPTNLFTETSMQANLDGEAVLWALSRLAQRPERTKLCIVLSDGMPAASLSNTQELERHLFTVCKRAEAREAQGLFLVGLGIKVERVREFYKNAAVIHAVEELPRAVLSIMEAVLAKVVGTLG